MQSHITQIKDVLPGYGDGYLAACLQHFQYNSEQVIHALLEDAEPKELQGLDVQMTMDQHLARQVKGKGKQPLHVANGGQHLQSECAFLPDKTIKIETARNVHVVFWDWCRLPTTTEALRLLKPCRPCAIHSLHGELRMIPVAGSCATGLAL